MAMEPRGVKLFQKVEELLGDILSAVSEYLIETGGKECSPNCSCNKEEKSRCMECETCNGNCEGFYIDHPDIDIDGNEFSYDEDPFSEAGEHVVKDILANKGAILKYGLNSKGQRKSVMLALDTQRYFGAKEFSVIVGWSMCHKEDKFDRKTGIKKAYQRALKSWEGDVVPVPDSMFDDLIHFLHRSQRYFFKNRRGDDPAF